MRATTTTSLTLNPFPPSTFKTEMATVTVSAYTHMRPVPFVSSPLAPSSAQNASGRPLPKRNTSFPTSRSLRPFPSISHSFVSSNQNRNASKTTPGAPKSNQVKLIEPPKNQKGTFVLNLTQAEFSRQD